MIFLLNKLQRLMALASVTFVQLVRMKVFLFLIVFFVILLGASTLRFNDVLGPETSGEQELTLYKNVVFGLMRIFGILFCVAATALLLPRDAEDRILYTILSKPMPRWEYLVGKLMGVLAVLGAVFLCMDILFAGVLEWKTSLVMAEQQRILSQSALDESAQAVVLERIAQQGNTLNLQLGLGVLFLQCAVLSALTLFLSIFSTSTIFSMISALCVFVIGLFQSDLLNIWFGNEAGRTMWDDMGSMMVAVVFPNFKIYEIVDESIAGTKIPLDLFGKLVMISVAYMVMYLSAAAFYFRKKEF